MDILGVETMTESFNEFESLDKLTRMAISTCHYVVELDNQYSGDALDMKLFLFSNSKIINRNEKRLINMACSSDFIQICQDDNNEDIEDRVLFFNSINEETKSNQLLEVLKIHDFDLYLKRMSVVVKNGTATYIFCKGAPDSISKILREIPEDYHEKVNEYSLQGHRVIALAYKEVQEHGNRNTDENQLSFMGFVIFANKLKEETAGVIKELREANIQPKMCTGDNILTAISVARECGMIDERMPVLFPVMDDGVKTHYDVEWYCIADENYLFDKVKLCLYSEFDKSSKIEFVVACEGKEYEYFKNTIYHSFILEKGVVFARFNPENKKDLVEDYCNNEFITMFCGDGANDTGALSSADVGLSLASNEASLAASFNSIELKATLDLIKEGRAALCTSALQFKYLFYSQTLAGIQMLALLPFLCFPADMMSLVNDMMSIYFITYAIISLQPSKILSETKVSVDLSSSCASVSLEMVLLLLIFISIILLSNKHEIKDHINLKSAHSTIIYLCTLFLLILAGLRYGRN